MIFRNKKRKSIFQFVMKQRFYRSFFSNSQPNRKKTRNQRKKNLLHFYSIFLKEGKGFPRSELRSSLLKNCLKPIFDSVRPFGFHLPLLAGSIAALRATCPIEKRTSLAQILCLKIVHSVQVQSCKQIVNCFSASNLNK